MADYVIGCDVGTSGTKSVVMDEGGAVLGSHYIEYPLITPRAGWAEQDPEWYWNAAADTIKVSIQKARIDPADIKGVSVSALAPACILVDKDLKPLQNAHIWMDRRGIEESKWLKERIGDDRSFEISANIIDPYYATVKLLWEKNNRPELYRQAYKIQTAADYPAMKLTGKAVTDYSNASLYSVCFDIVGRKWRTDIIEEIGLDAEKFPEAYPCDEVIGEVTAEAAERTGLKKGTPVVAGTVDANAAYVASGAISDGDFSLAMGTAGCMGVIHKDPRFTKNMVTIVHPANSKAMYSTLATTVCFGAVTRYFRDNFGQFEKLTADLLKIDVYELMNLEAANIPTGSDGMIILPYFMGERTPIWDPYARGVVFGMSLAHTRGHFLRALMEGAAYALYDNYKYMKNSGMNIRMPLVVGEGGAKSPLWRQIVSDVLNVPVAYMRESKGAPVGNAIVAGVGTGVFKNYDVAKEWLHITDNHSPNEEKHKKYMELYRIYENLYRNVKDDFARLMNV
jgi:xylulokinase